jgi:Cu/Ag efflux protein CusF
MDQQTPLFEEVPTPPPAPPPTEEDAFWGTTAEANPAGDKPHRPLRTWLAAGIGTAVIAAAAFAGVNLARNEGTTLAGASGPGGPGGGFGPGGFGGPGRGTNGTIASIDGSTFSVTTPAGTTVKVVTNSSTTFTVASTGSVSDIKPGDNVTVMGTTSGTTVDAERITDSGSLAVADGLGGPPPGGTQGTPPAGFGGQAPPDGRGGAPNAGVVKAVTGNSFTMTTTAGTTLTVNASSAAVTVVKAGSLATLKVGDQVSVNGTTSDNTVTATSVRAGDVGFGPADGRAAR